jgi:hypothetical protein
MVDTKEQDEFAVNYYRWSLDQWKGEIETNYSFLKASRNAEAQRVIGILEPLANTQAMQFARALLKRTHRRAVTVLGELPAADETALLQKLDDKRRSEMFRQQLLGTLRPKSEKSLTAPKRRLILNELTRSLSPILGPPKRDSGNGYFVQTPVGNWRLKTILDIGGNFDLAYYHDIPVGTAPGHFLARLISALSWFGINQTSWAGLTEEQIPGMADFVAQAARRFLDAAPNLLPKSV